MTKTRGRVLCLTSNFPRWPGDSTTAFALHLAADLQEIGWEVDVLAPHDDGAARSEVMGGVRVERFRYLWPVSAQTVCYRGGALVNVRRSRVNQAKLPALVAAEWAALARRMASGRYDLVHAHWILPQGLVATLPPRRAPVVVTAHGGDVFGLQGRVFRPAKRAALTRADAVTVNSSFTERAVRAIAPSLGEVRRIPMGVATTNPDPALVSELRRRYRQGEGPLVVFCGRLVEEKGVEDLLRAVGLLTGSLPYTTAVVIGDGQDRAGFEKLAADLGLSDRIVFPGWVDPALVGAHLAAGDVVVVPSRRGPDGWVEAQGLTAVEAMAAGTMVVASSRGGMVDAVIDGETGLLVNERAPHEIASAVERAVADDALGERCRDAGRRLALANFSRPASAEAFSRLFEELLG
jgi:phosphatidyl-myo-inositol dimannoside synthase